LRERVARGRDKRDRGVPTVPSTVGEERATNPFLRCIEPGVVAAAEARARRALADPMETFAVLRAWKNELAAGAGSWLTLPIPAPNIADNFGHLTIDRIAPFPNPLRRARDARRRVRDAGAGTFTCNASASVRRRIPARARSFRQG
jgi:hypothetical protein